MEIQEEIKQNIPKGFSAEEWVVPTSKAHTVSLEQYRDRHGPYTRKTHKFVKCSWFLFKKSKKKKQKKEWVNLKMGVIEIIQE